MSVGCSKDCHRDLFAASRRRRLPESRNWTAAAGRGSRGVDQITELLEEIERPSGEKDRAAVYGAGCDGFADQTTVEVGE